ncbi:hypothetical protein JEY40_17740 [Bradyrhizobium japonicum]|uniref:hypothetical protein n=2 Tax=Bradyrhizobium TaxID=374 RepID=UPI00200C1AA1|nr:hypothetical protein [Bradyrhizobium japonicum]UQD76225.1 hypothetical protein JEY40_17740 [Bradyrhizobium japonicum]WLB51074.1 hypothetical protein QIH94_27335 [Bradyrhizobium japonicum]WLB67152.1 hypothetical protein QIH96_18990 [Bradyrhizobium japonicum]
MWRFALFLAMTCSAHAEDLVGKRVPPFPDGMKQGGGTCISAGTRDPCPRVVGTLMDATGKEVAVYASILDGRDEKGKPFSIVTDMIPYPKLRKAHHLDWGSCRYDNVEDEAVIAVVRESRRTRLPAVDWAYRVDRTSGKLVKVDPARVDCYNTALEAD